MALVTMREMLKEARAHKYAVGAFEFWSYDSAYAVAKAAKSLNVPAILQVGPYEKEFMDGYKNAVAMAKMAAEHFDLPVAIHLDHAEEYDEVVEALEAGFTSVMIDASKYEFDKNVELTCKVVEKAKEYGASVEAEIGKLAGNEGNITNDEDEQTDPAMAAEFVRQTGIDCLAVAIGTAHGAYKHKPCLDLNRLAEIRSTIDTPLVLHGGSGLTDDDFRNTIKNGIAKVNIFTDLCLAGERACKRGLEENAGYLNMRNMKVEEIKKETMKKMLVFGCNGRA